jgi:Na+/melibiose symporter-like transporter
MESYLQNIFFLVLFCLLYFMLIIMVAIFLLEFYDSDVYFVSTNYVYIIIAFCTYIVRYKSNLYLFHTFIRYRVSLDILRILNREMIYKIV